MMEQLAASSLGGGLVGGRPIGPGAGALPLTGGVEWPVGGVEPPGTVAPASTVTLAPGMTMAEIEKAAILAALRETRGNRRKAAEILQIGERTMYRKLKEYQVPDRFGESGSGGVTPWGDGRLPPDSSHRGHSGGITPSLPVA